MPTAASTPGSRTAASESARVVAPTSSSTLWDGNPQTFSWRWGRAPEDVHCAVRFSLSSLTSVEDIDLAVAALGHVLQEMETTVRFLPCK
jgi:cysteine sulfinate desulfinase/cysteine desulfurase-like protein